LPTKIQTHQIDNSHCAQNSHAHHDTSSATLPPPVCIAAFIFHRHRLHCCSLFLYPPVFSSLLITAIWGWQVQIYLGSARNCGHLVIFQQENKGGGPVIGRLIALCVAAFIFRRPCHHCHRPFLVVVAVGVAVAAVGVAMAVGMAVGVALAVVVAVKRQWQGRGWWRWRWRW
jgi:hypothetical protein